MMKNDDILRAYVDGGFDLASAAVMTLRNDGHSLLAGALEHAFLQYQYGKVKDLADAFGPCVKVTQRERRAMEQRTFQSNVFYTINDIHRIQGLNKQDPSKYENTAFHEAAGQLHRSPSQLFKLYYAEYKRRVGG